MADAWVDVDGRRRNKDCGGVDYNKNVVMPTALMIGMMEVLLVGMLAIFSRGSEPYKSA